MEHVGKLAWREGGLLGEDNGLCAWIGISQPEEVSDERVNLGGEGEAWPVQNNIVDLHELLCAELGIDAGRLGLNCMVRLIACPRNPRAVGVYLQFLALQRNIM